MEELNLDDLNFDQSNIQLFDDNTGAQDPKQETGDETPSGEAVSKDENINTDGDDKGNPSQESVADQSKDTNQVQAGKTAE